MPRGRAAFRHCVSFWTDVLLLLLLVCPILVLVTAMVLGGTLAGVEGWPFADGFLAADRMAVLLVMARWEMGS